MYDRKLLREIRNDLPMNYTIERLAEEGPYAKHVDGRYRFVCPHCNELLAVLNPKNNLAHCFNCRQNINNIDLTIALGYAFREAVALLCQWLDAYRNENKHPPNEHKPGAKPPQTSNQDPQNIRQILANVFK